jgi:hypothetical protein
MGNEILSLWTKGSNPAPKQYQSLKTKEPPSPPVQPAKKQPAKDKDKK